MPPTWRSWPCRMPARSSRRPARSVTAHDAARGRHRPRPASRESPMPIKILMPALSPTMTEGNLAKWLKAEGEAVKPGDVIAEIETDKATMEVEAIDEGTLGKILVPAGAQAIKVNEPIALLLTEGEDAGALAVEAAPAPAATPAKTAAAAPPVAAPPAAAPAPPAASPPAAAPAAAAPAAAATERRFASPLARRMAAAAGLDLAAVGGSGPNGRIVKSDIEAALARGPAARPVAAPSAGAAPTAPAAPSAVGLPPFTEVPNSQTRQVIARRHGDS